MAKPRLHKDFTEFLQLLNFHAVKYLIIGGYAVSFHGYPRPTGDIDIWVHISPENASKLVTVLKMFGFDLTSLSEDLFLQENRVVRLGNPPVRIALLTTISGVNFDSCFSRKVVFNISGLPLNFISLEDLKVNKKAAGRNKDLADFENLP